MVNLAKSLLVDLATQHGADGVSISTVKKAVAAATGKSLPAASGKATKAQSSYLDVGRDPGQRRVASSSSPNWTPSWHAALALDQLHAGLGKVLAEVESRRSRAARKAASSAGQGGTGQAAEQGHGQRQARGQRVEASGPCRGRRSARPVS